MSNTNPRTPELFTNATRFDIFDWLVFGAMLLLSAGTGMYFAYKSRKTEANVSEYLMGSRKMKTFPVAMSLIGSYVSGVTIIGTPAEIFNYGTQYLLVVFAILLSGFIVAIVYVPVYFALKIESSYQYLELRFDKSLRMFASIMFLLDEMMFLPIVIYVPALAFSQVTGIDLYIIGSTVCLLCIFYTVLGGLKAVVWTDTWQIGIMFFALFLFTVIGIVQAGGFTTVWNKAYEGDRLEFLNVESTLYRRYTIWSVLIGGTMYWTAFNAINQTMVQRYMSLPSVNKAKKAIVMFSVSAVFVIALCCFTGLLVYERLGGCDPRVVGALEKDDQLLPAFISLVSITIPGALGVFVAGIFGAALSSMSVVLNSTATVILEDLVKGLAKKNPSESTSTLIARLTITTLGLISLAMLFVVKKLGGVLSVATSLSAIAASTMFGVFSLGMLWPWANARGAFVGALCGAIMVSWISVGSQTAAASGLIAPDYRKPVTDECPLGLNKTVDWPPDLYIDPEDVFPLYKLSYKWIAPIGIMTTFIVGIIVSALTQKANYDYTSLDPDLFSPVIHRFLPEKMMRNAGMISRALQEQHLENRPSQGPSSQLLNENLETNMTYQQSTDQELSRLPTGNLLYQNHKTNGSNKKADR